jgi:hypothetical protein
MSNIERAMSIDTYPDFPVTVYGGTKSIIISTRTVIGGKNPFLGIAYVVVGGLCIVLGTIFTVAHLVKPRYVVSPSQSYHAPYSHLISLIPLAPIRQRMNTQLTPYPQKTR